VTGVSADGNAPIAASCSHGNWHDATSSPQDCGSFRFTAERLRHQAGPVRFG
jgi:hypothetical protein